MEFDSFIGSDLISPIPEHHTEYLNEDEIFIEARKNAFCNYDVEMTEER